MNRTIAQAQAALDLAAQDATGDGHNVDECWSDLVQAVALDCTPGVAAELRRREGLDLEPTYLDPYCTDYVRVAVAVPNERAIAIAKANRRAAADRRKY